QFGFLSYRKNIGLVGHIICGQGREVLRFEEERENEKQKEDYPNGAEHGMNIGKY
ncbi:MAG: hypothetical protein K0S32_1545, partial [Bacteroidetes bacterium]|nr:hypothetical protein [Bacteroidota bacterium]